MNAVQQFEGGGYHLGTNAIAGQNGDVKCLCAGYLPGGRFIHIDVLFCFIVHSALLQRLG